MLHLEQPTYTDMPVYEQFIRDWDSFNNNEPFWSTVHTLNLPGMMQKAGFGHNEVFEDHVKAVDRREFAATADDGEQEDHGRAAAWYALGGWKGGLADLPA